MRFCVGLKLISLVCVGGWWFELFVFVFNVSGVMFVVIVVIGLLDDLLSDFVRLIGLCVML